MTSVELLAENSKLLERIQELEKQLATDALTGARSHRMLIEIQERRLKPTNNRVIAFDIKDFGEYNKKYGHHEGDRVLIMFVEKIKQALRVSDYVYRRGGDEFVAILNVIDYPNISDIQRRLEELDIHQTAYIGYSCGIMSVEELVIAAFAEVEKQKRVKNIS